MSEAVRSRRRPGTQHPRALQLLDGSLRTVATGIISIRLEKTGLIENQLKN